MVTLWGNHWGSITLCVPLQATAQAGLTIFPVSPSTAFLSVDSVIFNENFLHAATFPPRQEKGKKAAHLFILFNFFYFILFFNLDAFSCKTFGDFLSLRCFPFSQT